MTQWDSQHNINIWHHLKMYATGAQLEVLDAVPERLQSMRVPGQEYRRGYLYIRYTRTFSTPFKCNYEFYQMSMLGMAFRNFPKSCQIVIFKAVVLKPSNFKMYAEESWELKSIHLKLLRFRNTMLRNNKRQIIKWKTVE